MPYPQSDTGEEQAMMHLPVCTHEELSDTDLVALAKLRDRLAFALLWRRHHAGSLLFARRIVRNEADAQDVVQDAWLNVWMHLSRFEEAAKFYPWLIAIVRNLSLMKLRSQRRRRIVPIEPERLSNKNALYQYQDEGRNPEQEFEQSELRRFVQDQIASIPRSFRECLMATYLADSPVAAAAKRLNLTESALKGRLRRGKAELGHRIRKGFTESRDASAISPLRISSGAPLNSASPDRNLE